MSQTNDRREQVTPPSGPQKAPETLESYGRQVFEAASKVLSTLCGRAVQLTLDRITHGSPSMLASVLPAPWISMGIDATQGLSGTQSLIWKEADAIALAQLILGEEPTSGSGLSAEQQDALSETASQISGVIGTSLRAAWGKPLAFGPGTVSAVADVGGPLSMFREAPASFFCVAALTIKGAAASDVMLVVSSSLLKGLEKAQSGDAASIAKEGTVSATSASAQAQVPFAPLTQGEKAGSSNGIDMLLDVSLQVSVELGRTRLQIRDVLQLGPGSIVELDKQAGEAVDILVNDKLIAKGEVIIIDENFGVRLTTIASVTDRIRNLR